MSRHSILIKSLTAIFAICAGVLLLSTQYAVAETDNDTFIELSDNCFGYSTKTRETIALNDQVAACTTLIASSSEDEALYFTNLRAMAYIYKGTKQHKPLAYADINRVLAAGQGGAQAYANRAMLEATLNKNLAAALRDYDQAIALTQHKPRPRYFLARGTVRAAQYQLGTDMTGLGQALKDVDVMLDHDPDNQKAHKIRGWIVHQLRLDAQTNGATVSRG